MEPCNTNVQTWMEISLVGRGVSHGFFCTMSGSIYLNSTGERLFSQSFRVPPIPVLCDETKGTMLRWPRHTHTGDKRAMKER